MEIQNWKIKFRDEVKGPWKRTDWYITFPGIW